ncbi:phage antirepressor N-terminal domain-containing protein [Citrobacter sedlakii]|uniref:phage antirepressor N-terminal domain-containing protein n=1 Tax=Citrobacter sedlakii TaxID=67826 RepID=UPI0005A6D81C|nr:phage antirepressor N-terminal domain-containing protein [Citrobacter sedlakii]
MTSIAILEAVNTSYVPFNGQQVITAMAAGIAYVAMKPIVENLGMSWGTQQQKLARHIGKFGCIHMNIPSAGGIQKMLVLPLKKLNGWLFSINPEKVRADIRDKLIQYQEECFTILHDYWTKGQAVNPRKTSTDDRTPLRGLVNRIMGKTGIHYQPLYKMIHREFGVNHIDELTPKQVAEAMEYLAGKVLEGDLLPKDNKPIPFQSAMPLSGSGRTMIYTDEKGVVQGSYPLTEDQVVMSFDGFVKFFRGKGWLVAPKEEVIGAIQSLQ